MHSVYTQPIYKMILCILILAVGTVSSCRSGTPPATPTPTLFIPPPTATPTPIPDAIVKTALNVRTGPDTVYDRTGLVFGGDGLSVVGQAYDCTWLKVITPAGTQGWIASEYVELQKNCTDIRTAAIPATPTGAVILETSTITSTLTPSLPTTPQPATLSPTPSSTPVSTSAQNFVDQAPYTEDCDRRPVDTTCLRFDDNYVWLVRDNIAMLEERGTFQGKLVVVAIGSRADYYHVLGTSLVQEVAK